jgi:hypothetical protein
LEEEQGNYMYWYKIKTKTPWLLVCKWTIPTERPPLVNEI